MPRRSRVAERSAPIAEKKEIEFARLVKTDPVFFAQEVLGVSLWSAQKEILLSVRDNPRTSVRTGSGVGKSFDDAVCALWFLSTHRPSTVVTTAPTFRQVRDILWSEIRALWAGSKMVLGPNEPTQTGITMAGLGDALKWFAIGMTTEEPEKFQGFHNLNVLVIADEASGVPETIFAAIENPLAAGHTRLLLTGNPTQVSGSFHDAFASPIYKTFHISVFDTPNFTEFGITRDDIINGTWKEKTTGAMPYPFLTQPAWVAERVAEWGVGSPLWQVYVEGDFPEEAADTLIPLGLVEKAILRELPPTGGVVIGIDTARFGDDENVAIMRQGSKVVGSASWAKENTMSTTGRIIRLIEDWQPVRVNIDDAPIAAGVIDRLAEESYRVQPINVSEKLSSGKFYNVRAQMFWNLRTRFEQEDIDIPDIPKLKAQSTSMKYEFHSTGKLIVESKEKMKKRGLKSPDWADALALAFMGADRRSGKIAEVRYY